MSVTRVAACHLARLRRPRWQLAQETAFSFAYDQPESSGYGAGAEMFDKKLKEFSKGMLQSINIRAHSSARKPRPCRRCRRVISTS
mgnify:CR=1 FL=1